MPRLPRTHTPDAQLQPQTKLPTLHYTTLHYTSTEHVSAEHHKYECKKRGKDTKCPHNNLKCVNCDGCHAENGPGCSVWLKRRGPLKDVGPTQQNQPPGGRNNHAVNLADLVKSAKESQKQHKTKTKNPRPQDDNTNDEDGEKQWKWMPERTKRILTEPIQIAQLNVNRGPDVWCNKNIYEAPTYYYIKSQRPPDPTNHNTYYLLRKYWASK